MSRKKKFDWLARYVRVLDQKGGGSGVLLVFMMFFFLLSVVFYFLNTIHSQNKLAWSHKDQSIALQLADSAMDQVLSKIRNHQVSFPLEYIPPPTVTPVVQASLPMTISVPVGDGIYSAIAYTRIDYERDASNVPIRDIEFNVKYKIQTVVDSVKVGKGASGKLDTTLRRGVKAEFILVNFGRYMSYMFSNDAKSFGTGGSFNGPYHANGSVTMSNACDWNNKVLSFSGSVSNPFFDASYTTVIAGSFVDGGSMDYNSQNNQDALDTVDGAYSILANNGSPINGPCTQGTWIDGAHGGFAVKPAVINADQFSSVAQVVMSRQVLYDTQTYQLQGTGLTGVGPILLSGTQQLDDGVQTDPEDYPVRINLNALNKGRNTSGNSGVFGEWLVDDGLLGATASEAVSNYDAALASTYGLIIFVDGDACVWGKIPQASTSILNQNKKVTVVATGHINVVGDVLVSKSPYHTAAATPASTPINSDDISPNPTTENPTDDAIALLSANGNLYVDPYYAANPRFMWRTASQDMETAGETCRGGDLRLDAFIYAPFGVTGGGNGTYAATGPARGYRTYKTPGGSVKIGHFTFHGAISADSSGYLPNSCNASYDRYFDPKLKYNLPGIIPSGTSLTSWQEELNPPKLSP